MTMTDVPRTALEAAIEAGLEEVHLAILDGQKVASAVRSGYMRTIKHLASQAGLRPQDTILRYWDKAALASRVEHGDRK